MKRSVILGGVAGLAAVAGAALFFMNAQKADGPEARAGGPPAVAAARPRTPDEAVYIAKCQYCHLEMGPGTVTLAKRLGPEQALLANRKNLTADYVKSIVRNGINSMPPITRVEVSDAELEAIARHLARAGASTQKPSR